MRFSEVVLFVQIVHRGPEGVRWRSILLQCPPVMMTTIVLMSGRDNFGNSAPILTILSLLQAEIYGA